MKKKFIKLEPIEFINEARDMREITCVNEMGLFDVLVVAKGSSKKVLKQDFYELHTLITRPFKFVPNSINRILSVFIWAKYIRNLKADVISAHDIIALLIAYISTLFSFDKAKLVYDSHEFELARNSKRSKFSNFFIKHTEKFLMNRCSFSIMVNDSIADEVQRIHKLKTRPVVIRSVQNYVEIDNDVIKKQRMAFNSTYNFNQDDFIILYHGFITDGRGIENLIKSIQNTFGVKCIILGFGEDFYIENLKNLILELSLEDKVFFHSAVSPDKLWKYVGAVDAGIVMIDNICLSYYYSLPNKFFQNIQAHTPIIGSNFPEIKRIIDEYEIGITCSPDSPDLLSEAIMSLKNNKEMYYIYKSNLLKASKELCWENEKKILEQAYRNIF